MGFTFYMKTQKDLENLYSWSMFIQNSHQLSVPRYPRTYNTIIKDNGVKISKLVIPYSDSVRLSKIQVEIRSLENKLNPKNN